MNKFVHTFALIIFSAWMVMAQPQPDSLCSVSISGFISTNLDLVLIDSHTYAGLDSAATDEYDSLLDLPKPLHPPNNYLSIYFPHPEWTCLLGDNFMFDARNANDDLTNAVKTYLFQVETDILSDTVHLSFSIGSEYPSNLGIVLFDPVDSLYQNIRDSSAYDFISSSGPRSFYLSLGDSTPPQIEFLFPHQDTILFIDSSYIISWDNEDVSPIKYSIVSYSLNNGVDWDEIDSLSGNLTSCPWNTPSTTSDSARLKIKSEDWAGNYSETITDFIFRLLPPYPVIQLSDDELDFGPVIIGVTDSLIMKIYNHGGINLYIYNIILSRPDIFTCTWDQNDSTLAPYDSLEFYVLFTPLNFEPYFEYLTILNSDTTLDVFLTGSGTYTGMEDFCFAPSKFSFFPPRPNPCNSQTTISFVLPADEYAVLEVFNICGERVEVLVQDQLQAGYHSICFNADRLPSGLYFIQLKTASFIQVQKLLIVK